MTDREAFLAKLDLPSDELEHVHTAYIFAKYGHRGQTRDEGVRYFEHPRAVAEIIIDELGLKDDWRIVTVALLHDILEDTYLLSGSRIRNNFDDKTARWVKTLTKMPGVDYHARLRRCRTWQVLLVKLCDRLHNLRSFACWSDKRKKRYVEETCNVYLPLADRLVGMLPGGQLWRGEYLKREIQTQCDNFLKKLRQRNSRQSFTDSKRFSGLSEGRALGETGMRSNDVHSRGRSCTRKVSSK